jgi:hypothetical protein
VKIILEGPDNSGKTTLADVIRVGHKYFHPGGPPNGPQAEMRCLLDQRELVRRDESLVMDRCTAISQMVYAPHALFDLGRKTELSKFQALGVIVVYCRPTIDRLMAFENFTWRPEESDEHKQLIIRRQHEFIARYDQIMLDIPHVHYDFTTGIHAVHQQSLMIRGLNGDGDAELELRTMAWSAKDFATIGKS